jgi:hypothetical protein
MGTVVRQSRSPVSRSASTRAASFAACLCLLLSGCVSQGLAFRVDDRLTITAPGDRAEVTLPVTVRWSIRDFDVVKPGQAGSRPGTDAGYFAVFVDGTPQPPGKALAHLARKDRSCRPVDGCPDAEYFAARNIYTTSAQEITFEQLPRPADEKHKERHTVTIVLLDPAGKRLGESAFDVTFTLNRKDRS